MKTNTRFYVACLVMLPLALAVTGCTKTDPTAPKTKQPDKTKTDTDTDTETDTDDAAVDCTAIGDKDACTAKTNDCRWFVYEQGAKKNTGTCLKKIPDEKTCADIFNLELCVETKYLAKNCMVQGGKCVDFVSPTPPLSSKAMLNLAKTFSTAKDAALFDAVSQFNNDFSRYTPEQKKELFNEPDVGDTRLIHVLAKAPVNDVTRTAFTSVLNDPNFEAAQLKGKNSPLIALTAATRTDDDPAELKHVVKLVLDKGADAKDLPAENVPVYLSAIDASGDVKTLIDRYAEMTTDEHKKQWVAYVVKNASNFTKTAFKEVYKAAIAKKAQGEIDLLTTTLLTAMVDADVKAAPAARQLPKIIANSGEWFEPALDLKTATFVIGTSPAAKLPVAVATHLAAGASVKEVDYLKDVVTELGKKITGADWTSYTDPAFQNALKALFEGTAAQKDLAYNLVLGADLETPIFTNIAAVDWIRVAPAVRAAAETTINNEFKKIFDDMVSESMRKESLQRLLAMRATMGPNNGLQLSHILFTAPLTAASKDWITKIMAHLPDVGDATTIGKKEWLEQKVGAGAALPSVVDRLAVAELFMSPRRAADATPALFGDVLASFAAANVDVNAPNSLVPVAFAALDGAANPAADPAKAALLRRLAQIPAGAFRKAVTAGLVSDGTAPKTFTAPPSIAGAGLIQVLAAYPITADVVKLIKNFVADQADDAARRRLLEHKIGPKPIQSAVLSLTDGDGAGNLVGPGRLNPGPSELKNLFRVFIANKALRDLEDNYDLNRAQRLFAAFATSPDDWAALFAAFGPQHMDSFAGTATVDRTEAYAPAVKKIMSAGQESDKRFLVGAMFEEAIKSDLKDVVTLQDPIPSVPIPAILGGGTLGGTYEDATILKVGYTRALTSFERILKPDFGLNFTHLATDITAKPPVGPNKGSLIWMLAATVREYAATHPKVTPAKAQAVIKTIAKRFKKERIPDPANWNAYIEHKTDISKESAIDVTKSFGVDEKTARDLLNDK